MIDISFDFDLWLSWLNFNFWSINILGILSALVAFTSYKYDVKQNSQLLAGLIMLALVGMLGLFPIEWGYGTDRANYATDFLSVQNSLILTRANDFGFSALTSFLAGFLTVKQYFVVIAFIYLCNYYVTIRKLVSAKSFWLVGAVVLSMGFTGYCTNTMRAGLALSFIVLSFATYPNKWHMLICLIVGSSIHNSAVIPALVIGLCYFFPNTKLFYKCWFLSIPISFVAGGFFMNLFAGIGGDDRAKYYITDILGTSYNVGFRIDFIIYSLAPIAVGAYYIFKKRFTDKLYTLIYNSYILTNIFWILVIRANYSDRFAYLSWFMIPFVLMYPLLKQKMNLKENVWVGLILLGETMFRFFV